MEIKSNRKVEISLWNITFKKIKWGEKGKTDNCINEVYPNGSNQYERASHAEKSIYYRDIN